MRSTHEVCMERGEQKGGGGRKETLVQGSCEEGHCHVALEWCLSRCILGKWEKSGFHALAVGPKSPMLQGKHGKSIGQERKPRFQQCSLVRGHKQQMQDSGPEAGSPLACSTIALGESPNLYRVRCKQQEKGEGENQT